MTNSTVSTLRAIAAVAQKLSEDLERGRLWEGEGSDAVGLIRKYVNDLPINRF